MCLWFLTGMFVHQLQWWRNQCSVFGIFFLFGWREIFGRVNNARNCRICTINKMKSVFCLFVNFFRSFIHSIVRFSNLVFRPTHMFTAAMKVNMLSSNSCRLIQSIFAVSFQADCFTFIPIRCTFILTPFPVQQKTCGIKCKQNLHWHKQKSTHYTNACQVKTKSKTNQFNGIDKTKSKKPKWNIIVNEWKEKKIQRKAQFYWLDWNSIHKLWTCIWFSVSNSETTSFAWLKIHID